MSAVTGHEGARPVVTKRHAGMLIGAVVSGVLMAGCATTAVGGVAPSASVTAGSGAAGSGTASSPALLGTAAAALDALRVKGRAPKTGYTRGQFGQAWADVDGNGCDTRNDILGAQLTAVTFKPGTHGCVVLTGTLADPYTGRTIAFTRGATTSTAVQIDHVVALSDAWQTGAQQLSATAREALANDPLNLVAVDGPTNEAKSDGDAATWLPPNKSERCEYVARQVAVKTRYDLWVTPGEHDAIGALLASCPNQPLPSSGFRPAG